jgi:hypothetical protein
MIGDRRPHPALLLALSCKADLASGKPTTVLTPGAVRALAAIGCRGARTVADAVAGHFSFFLERWILVFFSF